MTSSRQGSQGASQGARQPSVFVWTRQQLLAHTNERITTSYNYNQLAASEIVVIAGCLCTRTYVCVRATRQTDGARQVCVYVSVVR